MRQVYFDPFGSYTSGLNQGINTQLNIEQQTRANRGSDWDYFNMNPIKLETANRENAYQRWGEPMRRESAQLGLEGLRRGNSTAEINYQTMFGLPKGITQPAMDSYLNYSGLSMQPTATPGQFNYVDQMGRVVSTQNDPGKQMLDLNMYDTSRKQALQDWEMGYKNFDQQMDVNKFRADQYWKPYWLAAQAGNQGGGGVANPFYGDAYGQPTQPTQPSMPTQPTAAPMAPQNAGMPPWLMQLLGGYR